MAAGLLRDLQVLNLQLVQGFRVFQNLPSITFSKTSLGTGSHFRPGLDFWRVSLLAGLAGRVSPGGSHFWAGSTSGRVSPLGWFHFWLGLAFAWSYFP